VLKQLSLYTEKRLAVLQQFYRNAEFADPAIFFDFVRRRYIAVPNVAVVPPGVPALRAAAILSELSDNAVAVDRAGEGKLVEVYPAASLARWGFAKTGKREFATLVPLFLDSVSGWLRASEQSKATLTICRDAFDALIASLTARACATGLCEAIPPEHVDSAKTEGWIALPKQGSLNRLPK
jgi:predicted nuclease with RNAse H fold